MCGNSTSPAFQATSPMRGGFATCDLRAALAALVSSPQGVAGGEAKPAADEAADDVEREVGQGREDGASTDEGEEFHVVRRKGREAAQDTCDEEEFDDGRQIAAFGEEDEEDADAEGPDEVGQDGAVWEEYAAVEVGQFCE